ncbi:MAG TPA: hypothetical protein VHL09_13110 [Dehalococcoidia bacterium]|nr:hypothetical protein [Dehalococcoidia bacterium]
MSMLAKSDRRIALLLWVGLITVYLFFYRGTLKNAADEWFMFALADSIARTADVTVDQMAFVGEYKGLAKLGPDGHLYSKYSFIQSLLAVPLLWIGRLIPWLGQAQLTLLVNPVLTALTAVLLFACGRQLGYGVAPALGAGLSFGLATTALVYAKTFTSEVSTGFGLALAVVAALRFRKTGSLRWIGLSGAALGVIVLSKQANAAAVPGLAIGLWLSRRWTTGAWLAFGTPLVVAGLSIAGYNALRFGDPWQTGYGPADGTFSAPWALSLPGLLISPGRGLLWYSPVLWLALIGCLAFARRHRWEALLLALAALPFALLYAKWHGWHGGLAAWGPRYWIPLLPLACLLLLPVFEALGRPRRNLAWLATAGVIGLSVAIQVSAAAFDYLPYIDEVGRARSIDLLNEDEQLGRLAFELPHSPLIHQWRFARPRYADVAWLTAGTDGEVRLDAVSGVALATLIAVFVVIIVRRRGERFLVLAALLMLVAGLAVVASASRAAAGPAWADAIRDLDRRSGSDEAVVTIGTEALGATFTWLKSGVKHYGLSPPDGTLTAETVRWLNLATGDRCRVWLAWRSPAGDAVARHLGTLAVRPSEPVPGPVKVQRFALCPDS